MRKNWLETYFHCNNTVRHHDTWIVTNRILLALFFNFSKSTLLGIFHLQNTCKLSSSFLYSAWINKKNNHAKSKMSLSIFAHNAKTGDHYNIGNENAKAFHSEIRENAKQILGCRIGFHTYRTSWLLTESNFLHLKVIRNIFLYFLLFEQIYIWTLLNS